MKKLLLCAAFAVFGFTNVNAQELTFGAKAGLNLAGINGDDVDADGRTSLHVGGVAKIGISEALAVQPEIVFSAQGYSNDLAGMDTTVKLLYINVPIFVDYTIVDGLSLQGGPQVGFNIGKEIEVNGNSTDIEDGIQTLDLGAGIGAQYRLPDLGLFFQARYVIGLSNIFEDVAGVSVDGKNSVASLSVGWFFN